VQAGLELEAASAEAGGAATGDVVLFQKQGLQTCLGGVGGSYQTTIAGTDHNYIELLVHGVPPFLIIPVVSIFSIPFISSKFNAQKKNRQYAVVCG
jgi:hypothetical protein